LDGGSCFTFKAAIFWTRGELPPIWLRQAEPVRHRARALSPATTTETFLPRQQNTMLDTFEILTTSGVVLWSRNYAPVGANIINSLIRDVFIEERILPQADEVGSKPIYRKEGYTLKWTAAKDLGLIFVVRGREQTQALAQS
jgi:hypothetical protein